MKTRAKKGLFKGSNPQYGYEVEEGKLYIRKDETLEIVPQIYKEYLEGSGRKSIARRLYNEVVKTPTDVAGKKNASDKWNDSTHQSQLNEFSLCWGFGSGAHNYCEWCYK
ncbi:recombinase family protein [Bacillus subtilis]|uniref:recombinase family protein n=1 Tax=Bacillus sp. SG20033 TaxID=3366583 RepID=UPI0037CBABA7